VRYIDEETREALKHLEEATADPKSEPLLLECRQQYRFLTEQLGRLQLDLENPFVLTEIKKSIKRIHAASERMKAIL
jgi:hypothetical protein